MSEKEKIELMVSAGIKRKGEEFAIGLSLLKKGITRKRTEDREVRGRNALIIVSDEPKRKLIRR